MNRLNSERWLRLAAVIVAGVMLTLNAAKSSAEDEKPAEASEKPAAAEVDSEEELKEDVEADHGGEEAHGGGDHEGGDHGAGEDHGDGEHSDHGGHHAHHDLGHGNATDSLNSPANFAGDLAIYTFVVFVGLLMLLGKFAWPTISNALEAREKHIEGSIADAERKLEEAKALVSEREAKLAGAADEVRELLEEARRDADATIAQAKADAKAEFEAERDRATRDIEQATDAAVRQLAENSATLAIDLAGRVVKQDLSADRQSEIVKEALGRFSAN